MSKNKLPEGYKWVPAGNDTLLQDWNGKAVGAVTRLPDGRSSWSTTGKPGETLTGRTPCFHDAAQKIERIVCENLPEPAEEEGISEEDFKVWLQMVNRQLLNLSRQVTDAMLLGPGCLKTGTSRDLALRVGATEALFEALKRKGMINGGMVETRRILEIEKLEEGGEL